MCKISPKWPIMFRKVKKSHQISERSQKKFEILETLPTDHKWSRLLSKCTKRPIKCLKRFQKQKNVQKLQYSHNVQKGFLNRLKGPKHPNTFQSHPKYFKCLNKSDKKPNVLEGVKYAIFPSKISEINRIMFRKVKKDP